MSKGTAKRIEWRGSSKEDLIHFPEDARGEAGHQLWLVQQGEDPEHWKPFTEAGAGAKEIIVDVADGWYRVMYVAKFEEAVYVLHCFQKKTNKTSRQDVEKASTRYSDLVAERKGMKK